VTARGGDGNLESPLMLRGLESITGRAAARCVMPCVKLLARVARVACREDWVIVTKGRGVAGL
jgi:hypothetical protein